MCQMVTRYVNGWRDVQYQPEIKIGCRVHGISGLRHSTASTDQGRSRDDPEVSYRAARQGSDWWPVDLGTPSAVGAQK